MSSPNSSVPSETDLSSKPTPRLLVTLARLAVGIGLLVYLAESKTIDLRLLSRVVTAWPITIAAIALILLDTALMAWRLCCLFRSHGICLAFSASLQLTLISSCFSTFMPGRTGGDLIKAFYVSKENSGRRTELITVLMFDRAIGFFSLLVLPLLFAPMFPDLLRTEPIVRVLLITVALCTSLMLAAFSLCVFNLPMVNRLAQGQLGFLRLRNLVGRSLMAVSVSGRNPGMLGLAFGLSILANLTLIGVMALGVEAVSPGSLAMKMVLIIPIGSIANGLPLTPGGLGVGETAFNSLFKITGLTGGAEALLCWRIWTAMVGLLGLVLYLRGFRGRVFDVESTSA